MAIVDSLYLGAIYSKFAGALPKDPSQCCGYKAPTVPLGHALENRLEAIKPGR